MSKAPKNNKIVPSTEAPCCGVEEARVTKADLPLSCPPRHERVWDGHPRVYLPIEELGKVMCPYCGTRYTLE